MAKAPTAPKPAAKHTVFPQMAFRCNYVLSIQNLWCAEREEPAERKWHFNIKINNKGVTGAECFIRGQSLCTANLPIFHSLTKADMVFPGCCNPAQQE